MRDIPRVCTQVKRAGDNSLSESASGELPFCTCLHALSLGHHPTITDKYIKPLSTEAAAHGLIVKW